MAKMTELEKSFDTKLETLDFLEERIRANPFDASLRINAAGEYILHGLYEAAKMHLMAAMVFNPKSPSVYDSLFDMWNNLKHFNPHKKRTYDSIVIVFVALGAENGAYSEGAEKFILN